MAGTRTEKLGSVFTRVTGLLRSGAMPESDKPIWYDIMARFPPRIEPKYDRVLDKRRTIDIVYREDFIRSKFYEKFANPGPIIDMKDVHTKTTCNRFIEKFQELEKKGNYETEESIFNAAVNCLKEEGVVLISEQKESQDQLQTLKKEETVEPSKMSFLEEIREDYADKSLGNQQYKFDLESDDELDKLTNDNDIKE